MTIDPAKFEPQGKPTKEQVRTVWDSMPAASARKVAAELEKRGFDISFRTIARWKKTGWVDEAPKPLSERLHETVRKEATKMVDKHVKAEPIAADGAPTLPPGDAERIEAMVKDLAGKDINVLREIQEKKRTILNIVMMEETTRKAYALALIPKDTSAIIGAWTDDAKVLSPVAPIQPGADGVRPASNGHLPSPTIEGDFKVVNPTSHAIHQFLAKENA